MSTLIRSAKQLPPHLATVDAWKSRLSSEPPHTVLADAYEYNLWYLDENGVPSVTNHEIHETTPENFLHSSAYTYAEAMVEVLKRRGYSPYGALVDEAYKSGAPESAITGLRVCMASAERHQLMS